MREMGEIKDDRRSLIKRLTAGATVAKWALTVSLAFMAAPALSGTYCIFETECMESEACAPSSFRFDFTEGGNPDPAATSSVINATTEFGDLAGFFLKQEGESNVIAFEGAGAFYFLSVAGRDARLSVHMEGPIVVTYLGACEELQ